MNAYFQRVSLKNRVQGTKRRLDPVYRTGRGDPSDFGGPTIRRGSSRFTTIGALENCVSLLQIACVHIEQIRGWLQEMKDYYRSFLHRAFHDTEFCGERIFGGSSN